MPPQAITTIKGKPPQAAPLQTRGTELNHILIKLEIVRTNYVKIENLSGLFLYINNTLLQLGYKVNMNYKRGNIDTFMYLDQVQIISFFQPLKPHLH